MPETPPNAKPSNGMVSLLATLAQSTNKWVQLGTLALIGLSGLGNWMATWNSADRNKTEIEISRRVAWEGEQRIKAEVVRQIQEMHDWVDQARTAFSQGNADSAENRKMLSKLTQDVDELKRKLNQGP
jgi:Flp pilus assembly protein TadB